MSLRPVAVTTPAARVTIAARPVRTVLALVGLSIGVTVAGAFLVEWLAPESDQLLRRLPVTPQPDHAVRLNERNERSCIRIRSTTL